MAPPPDIGTSLRSPCGLFADGSGNSWQNKDTTVRASSNLRQTGSKKHTAEAYAKAYATGLLCFVLFKVVPLGGWGHALFHVGAAPYFLFLLEASEKVRENLDLQPHKPAH